MGAVVLGKSNLSKPSRFGTAKYPDEGGSNYFTQLFLKRRNVVPKMSGLTTKVGLLGLGLPWTPDNLASTSPLERTGRIARPNLLKDFRGSFVNRTGRSPGPVSSSVFFVKPTTPDVSTELDSLRQGIDCSCSVASLAYPSDEWYLVTAPRAFRRPTVQVPPLGKEERVLDLEGMPIPTGESRGRWARGCGSSFLVFGGEGSPCWWRV